MLGWLKTLKEDIQNTKKCLLDETAEGKTALSTCFWQKTNSGGDPKVTWKFIERNVPTYNPITSVYFALERNLPELASLNSRQEIFSHCRHLQTELLAPD
jgi:hypothetical protein